MATADPQREEETLRQELLADISEGMEGGWEENYGPDSFGQHELLDRTFITGDMVEDIVLSHPACVLNPEWFALAHRATEALHELYQRVAAASLEEEGEEGMTGEI